jgi:hypothetical protein
VEVEGNLFTISVLLSMKTKKKTRGDNQKKMFSPDSSWKFYTLVRRRYRSSPCVGFVVDMTMNQPPENILTKKPTTMPLQMMG